MSEIICTKCYTEMICEDFYEDENNNFVEIWYCPDCGTRKEIAD